MPSTPFNLITHNSLRRRVSTLPKNVEADFVFSKKSTIYLFSKTEKQNSRSIVVADGIGDLDIEPDGVQGKATGSHAHPDGVLSGGDTSLPRLKWYISGVPFLLEGLEVRVAQG